MALTHIELVGCKIYSDQGQIFVKDKVYWVKDDYARVLLSKKDDYGRRYFAIAVEEVAEDEEMQRRSLKKKGKKKPVQQVEAPVIKVAKRVVEKSPVADMVVTVTDKDEGDGPEGEGNPTEDAVEV